MNVKLGKMNNLVKNKISLKGRYLFRVLSSDLKPLKRLKLYTELIEKILFEKKYNILLQP